MPTKRLCRLAGLSILVVGLFAGFVCGVKKTAARGPGPAPTAAASVPAADPTSVSVRGTTPCVATLSPAVSKLEALRAVTRAGARVIGPLPPNAFLIEASPSARMRLAGDARFAAVTELLAEAKVASGFTEGLATVIALSEEDLASLSAFCRAGGGDVVTEGPRGRTSLVVRLPAALVPALAARGDVRWIEGRTELKTQNDLATEATHVLDVRATLDLTGSGQVVAIADTGLDTGVLETLHADFAGRVEALVNLGGHTTGDYSGHGTHTAGSLVGSGACSQGLYAGVAPEARLVAFCCGRETNSRTIEFNNAETWDDVFTPGLAYGAFIQSDSWGGDDKGAYAEICSALDDAVWRHPELLVVVANGNAGSAAQTVGSPATAKNCLAVGNAFTARNGYTPGNVAINSSRGPCADGRIKPDVTAPGSGIVSTRSSLCTAAAFEGRTAYAAMSGTSMATPHAAGCAALVREWLMTRQGVTNALPTAALLKAILTGGARADTLTPNNKRGWGFLDLAETLAPSNRMVRFVDRVPYAELTCATYGFTLTNAAPLDVQLAWLDYPALAGAARTLVNDLDLVVSNRTTGAVWYGNDVAGGDRTNTVESVRLSTAPAGDYDVSVIGRDIVYGSAFGGAAALYVRGAMDGSWSADEPEMGRILRVDAAARDDVPADGSSAAPFKTISAALSDARSGDVVSVAPGRYAGFAAPGPLVDVVASEGPAQTVIDGEGRRRCYDGSKNPYAIVEGFSLVNGRAETGGGAYAATLVGCVVSNCTATLAGGGASDTELDSCLLVGNVAVSSSSLRTKRTAYGGGACDCYLYNCTLVANAVRSRHGAAYGGGAYVSQATYGCAYNTILCDNVAEGALGSFGPDLYDNGDNTAACWVGGDPCFADAARSDYRLRADSPALDAGLNGAVMTARDLDGNARIFGAHVDAGAYEYARVATGWPTPSIRPGARPDEEAAAVAAALLAAGFAPEAATRVTTLIDYLKLGAWAEEKGVSVASQAASGTALLSPALGADGLLALTPEELRVFDLAFGTNAAGRVALTFTLGLADYARARADPSLIVAAVGAVGADEPAGHYASDGLEVRVRPADTGIEITVLPPPDRAAYFLRGTIR